MGLNIPDLSGLLPLLGSVGLILIVLEGSLELEMNRSKRLVILRSFLVAVLPMLLLSIGLGWLLHSRLGLDLRTCLINLIPLSVISSSIAISAGRNLDSAGKEFVVYESSLSDIIGVLLFNFVSLNERVNSAAIGTFSLQLTLIIVVSFVATILLSYMLNKIDHHIKFAPIILLVILIYEISKLYHLPGLLFILLFGLFLGNLEEFAQSKWIRRLGPENLQREVRKFREITNEATFLIRSLFFLLFGFLIKGSELFDLDTLGYSMLFVAAIFVTRGISLLVTGIPLLPFLFFAPRGLITILLYFAIPPAQRMGIVSNSLVVQVIVITAIAMMIGMVFTKPGNKRVNPNEKNETGLTPG